MLLLSSMFWLAFITILHLPRCHCISRFQVPLPSGFNKDYDDNRVYEIGSILFLQWEMDMVNVKLGISQDSSPADPMRPMPAMELITTPTNQTYYSWTVSYLGMDPRQNNVFYFSVFPDGDPASAFNSHYFNITDRLIESSSTTSMVLPTSISTITTSTITTSTSSASKTTIASEIPTTSPAVPSTTSQPTSSTLSGGQIVGIVIGAIAGIAAIAFAGCYMVRGKGIELYVGVRAGEPPTKDNNSLESFGPETTDDKSKITSEIFSYPLYETDGSESKHGDRHELPE